ncbi:hypothetical protein ACOSQ2_003026 [Xanthoceras sorbifolium]
MFFKIPSIYQLPWLIAGDFNEIIYSFEKVGELLRSARLISDFRNVLDDCALEDLGFRGNQFTWCNGREGADFIQARFDRSVSNMSWHDLFPDSVVTHLDF